MLEKLKFLAVELECTTIFGSACTVAQMLNKIYIYIYISSSPVAHIIKLLFPPFFLFLSD